MRRSLLSETLKQQQQAICKFKLRIIIIQT